MNSADWTWLQAETRRAAQDFAHQLSGITDTSVRVPNLDWNVAELAAHLISLTDMYCKQNQVASFAPPDDWARFSIDARGDVNETDAAELALMIVAAADDLIAEVGSDPTAARTLYGQATTASNTIGGLLAELKMHGRDLAALTGAKVDITARHALSAIPQMMALAPVFVDPVKAKGCDGTFDIRIKGGLDYTYTVVDGRMTVTSGRPERADAHMRADPVAMLLVPLGRMSQVRASLTGKIRAFGRKPWLLLKLGNATVGGI